MRVDAAPGAGTRSAHEHAELGTCRIVTTADDEDPEPSMTAASIEPGKPVTFDASDGSIAIAGLTSRIGPGRFPGRGSGESTRYNRGLWWGTVWCEFDPRSASSTTGLRYATS
jgi:hypothetical protein